MPVTFFAAVVLVASVLPVQGGSSVGDPILGGLLSDGDGWIPFGLGLTAPFHFVGYAILAVLSARATGGGVRSLVSAAALAVGFGFGVELVQSTIPWRTFAWGDAAVNALGAGGGIAAVAVIRRVTATRAAGASARDR